MRNLNKQAKKGFSLIELLLVLGIIAALAITAFMVFPKVSSSNKAQTEATNLNTIKAAVNSLYASSPDYKDLDLPTALAAKVFPDTMVSGDKAINSFKGAVTLVASDDAPSGATDSAFTITYAGVPSAECAKIVSAVSTNFYTIKVGETAVKDGAAGTGLAIKDLTTECNKSNKNDLTFIAL